MKCFYFCFAPLAAFFCIIFSVWMTMAGADGKVISIVPLALSRTLSAGKLCWIALVFVCAQLCMKRAQFDPKSMSIVFAGISLFYTGIMNFDYYEFAHDPISHIQAIEYIVHTGDWLVQRPTVAIKNPLYYTLAALVYLGAQTLEWDPGFVVRQLSLGFYLVYLYFAFLTIRLSIRTLSLQQLVFALLVFWPIGFSMPARITPDIPLYACNMAVFYFLLVWHQQKNAYYLGLALVGSGYAILLKNIGLINPAIIAATVLLSIVVKRCSWRHLLSWHVFWPFLFNILAFCLTYNNIAGAHQRLGYLESHASLNAIASRAHLFLTFDYSQYLHLLVSGWTIYSDPGISFWTCFMADLFFGEPGLMQWKCAWLELVIGMIGLCLCVQVLFFGFYQTFIERKNRFFNVLAFIAVLIPVLALLINRVVFTDYKYIEAYADPRYAFQIVVLFCIMHGKALEWHQTSQRKELFYAGCGATMIFIIASIAMYLHNRLGIVHP